MIRVDPRIGSGPFLKMMNRLGAPCRPKRMTFGDFSFFGNGPHGRVRVGIERKTISEICGSIGDARFTGHQLPGLIKTYDYVWVIIEGYSAVDPQSGVLMQGKWSAGFGPQRHLYSTIKKFELTLAVKGNVRIEHTKTKIETAFFLRTLFDWWSEPWKKHKSIYHVEETKPDAAILDRRTLKRRLAAQLPGVAWERSARVDRYFPSIVEMATAPESEWRAALGVKEGRKLAAGIVKVLHAQQN